MKKLDEQALLHDLFHFITASPSVFHAAKEVGTRLAEANFEPLNERERWKLEPKGKYFTVRDHAAVIAFCMPKKPPKRAIILSSHLDSPALKIKPEFISEAKHYFQLPIELYGGPLISSWLNRDLGIAGRIITDQGLSLVNIDDMPSVIPQLAIHLDREVNEKGLKLNKQDHLRPLVALSHFDVEKRLKEDTFFHELYSHDLFFYPLEKPSFLGPKQEMIASYRLDNLTSSFASIYAMKEAKESEDTLYVSVFWDHEEIGSKTHSGAESSYLLDVLKRISSSYQMDNEAFFMMKNSSLNVSIDVTHAHHPNFPNKEDTPFTPKLGEGVSIKFNAQQKYMSSAISSAKIISLCRQQKIPLQKFAGRADMPTGSTVGPPMAATLGMHTADIGLPLLSMHSTRELIGSQDQIDLCRLLHQLLNQF